PTFGKGFAPRPRPRVPSGLVHRPHRGEPSGRRRQLHGACRTMAKQMAFDVEARDRLRAGVEKIARAVGSTLGPKGRNAILDKSWGGESITQEGVTVADEIELED